MAATAERMDDNMVCNSDAAAAVDPESLTVAVTAVKECPKGHRLIYARAPAGTCDGCTSPVSEGQLVSNCSECNWYLCTTCSPIEECPKGHELRLGAAEQGTCDGCGSKVKQGAMVMQCFTCNVYLCGRCQPPTQCPSGHVLQLRISESVSECGICGKLSNHGDTVMDCRSCEWHACEACHPKARACCTDESAPAKALPQCPKGHDAVPGAVTFNASCDQCARKIGKGRIASACEQCDWHLCTACHPIRQCPLGHELEARPASPGTCDGCGTKVHLNQAVLACRPCNWYLCALCHMPPAQAQGGA